VLYNVEITHFILTVKHFPLHKYIAPIDLFHYTCCPAQMVNPNAAKVEGAAHLICGSSGICLDGRESHGSGQGKLLHKGAHLQLTACLAQSDLRLFVSQLPLACQSQHSESMLIDVHPSKFQKNLICPASPAKSTLWVA